MINIKQFFTKLNNDIRSSKTLKALRLLDKRGKSFVDNLRNPQYDKTLLKQATAKYKQSKKLISVKLKRIA